MRSNVGAYSGDLPSSARVAAFLALTQSMALAPSTSSSQRNGSAGDGDGACWAVSAATAVRRAAANGRKLRVEEWFMSFLTVRPQVYRSTGSIKTAVKKRLSVDGYGGSDWKS